MMKFRAIYLFMVSMINFQYNQIQISKCKVRYAINLLAALLEVEFVL